VFGPIGGTELLIILVLALLLFGPRRLPQLGRTIGRALAEFRGATQEFRASLDRELRVEELRRVREELAAGTEREAPDGSAGPAAAVAVVPSAPASHADRPESS
jgi:Tat protein translocase TatB subunit